MRADEGVQEVADRIGRHVSTVIIAALAALFAYGYIGWRVFG